MARKQKRTKEVENVRAYLEGVAKNLADKLYGPQGPAWGTKLTDIEDLCLDIREVVSEALLNQALQCQAAAHEQQRQEQFCVCPECPRALDWGAKETQERMLETQAGEAEWPEPAGYCRRCRRAFFSPNPAARGLINVRTARRSSRRLCTRGRPAALSRMPVRCCTSWPISRPTRSRWNG